jgi:hypothetical protein
MSLLQVAVILVSVVLVGTKALDCWSTHLFVVESSVETNPIARSAMTRFGRRLTIWVVFVVVVLIIAVVGGAAFRIAGELAAQAEAETSRHLYVWGYLLLGTVISVVQAAVAETNRSGEFNRIAAVILTLNDWLGRVRSRDH